MHTAEEVRKEAEMLPQQWPIVKMAYAYADLLEAMEEMDKNGSEIAYSAMHDLRWRAAEKARSRK